MTPRDGKVEVASFLIHHLHLHLHLRLSSVFYSAFSNPFDVLFAMFGPILRLGVSNIISDSGLGSSFQHQSRKSQSILRKQSESISLDFDEIYHHDVPEGRSTPATPSLYNAILH